MTDQTYNGFRFQWDRRDANQPKGVLTRHCIVVARSRAEAVEILSENITGSMTGVGLINMGPDVLAEARKRGIADGQAVIL